MKLTNAQLDDFIALSEKAVDEWFTVSGTNEYDETTVYVSAGDYAFEGEPDLLIEIQDAEDEVSVAEFIAQARNLMPQMARELKQAREELGRIEYLGRYYSAKLSCHHDKDTGEPLKIDPVAQEFYEIARQALAYDAEDGESE